MVDLEPSGSPQERRKSMESRWKNATSPQEEREKLEEQEEQEVSPRAILKKKKLKSRRPSVAKLYDTGRVRALSQGHSGEEALVPVEILAVREDGTVEPPPPEACDAAAETTAKRRSWAMREVEKVKDMARVSIEKVRRRAKSTDEEKPNKASSTSVSKGAPVKASSKGAAPRQSSQAKTQKEEARCAAEADATAKREVAETAYQEQQKQEAETAAREREAEQKSAASKKTAGKAKTNSISTEPPRAVTPPLDPLVPTPASVFVDEAAVREVLRPWSTIKVVGAATAVALLAVVTSALLRTLFA